jgi:hypothetical protein
LLPRVQSKTQRDDVPVAASSSVAPYSSVNNAMSVANRFEKFISSIQLTPAQHADATIKANGVMDALSAAYYPSGGRVGHIVGSYGKGTAVRPPRDVDVLFPMPTSEWFRINGVSGNKQSRLLQEVRQVLADRYPRTDMRADGQVVVVPFTTFGIEVVPAFELGQGSFQICDTNNGGKWKTAAPWAERVSLDASNRATNGNTVRLIQMMKVWQQNCNVPLSSVQIELLAIEFLGGWEHASGSLVWADWMVREFFAFLLNRANSYLFMPGTFELLFLGSGWCSRAQSAYERAVQACDDEPNFPYLAGAEWQKIFGDMFAGA